jgi:hypothetical protein
MGLFTERDEETTNEIIIGKLNRIEAKLDAVIKALHEYDGNDEYGESSFEAFQLTNEYLSSLNEKEAERIPPCVGHDKASWDDEEAERRMDIIGQNGNEGLHYVTNEEADEDAATFDDYGMRVVKDKNNDIQDKRTVGEKDKHVGKKKRDKWVSPYPPNPKRKFTQDLIPKNKG